MRFKPSAPILLLVVAFAIIAVACGGDSEGGEDGGNGSGADTSQATSTPSRPTVQPTATSTPKPVLRHPGLVLELQQGDFWEFRWMFSDQSCAQGSGCSSSEDGGVFTVTLGEPQTIRDVEMFAISVSGRHTTNDGASNLAPGWNYIGATETQIVASDGFSLVTIFDALDGEWIGGGFFYRFSRSETHASRPTSIGSQPFASWPGVKSGPAVSVVRSDSQSMCDVIEGRRICPNDQSFSISETQYYQDEVGPVGYTFRSSASFSGGGFFSSSSDEETVALVRSSLRGDAIPATPTPFPTRAVPTPPSGELPPRLGVPTPTPEIELDVYFGPEDGSLTLVNIDDQIPDFETGVDLLIGVVDVVFVNPDVGGGEWSYGITFRHSAEEEFHAVYVTSNGQWQHFSRGGTGESQVSTPLQSVSPAVMDLTPGGENRVFVAFDADQAALFVNGDLVGGLDLSTSNARVSGDVRVIAGVLSTDTYNGAESEYYDLTVLGP